MSTESNRADVLDELEDILREPVERIRKDPPPSAEMTATLNRVTSLCEQPPTTNTVSLLWVLSKRHVGLLGGMTAAAVLLAFLVVSDPAQSLAAEVAESLSKCDWVHVVQDMEGEKEDTWFSFKGDISIRSDVESIEFRRHRELEFERYEKAEQTLYRLSEQGTPRRFNPLAGLADALPLLVDDNPNEGPINDLGLLRQFGRQVQIGGNRIVGGQGFSNLIVDLNVDGRAAEVVISVDEATKLPKVLKIISGENDKTLLSFMFDYPTTGPKDIYALGVPKDAKIVDRVLRESEEFLLASVMNGSSNFDDYRALAITYDVGDELWWINARKELVYRKGKKWRRSHLYVDFNPDPKLTKPAEALSKIRDSGPADGTNLADWWTERLKNSPKPEGNLSEVFVGHEQAIGRWSLLPEFHARPPIGQSSLNRQVSVDLDPGDGPDGTILIECTKGGSSQKRNVGKVNLDKMPVRSQFWVDPQKGHLVMLMQMFNSDGELIGRTEVESTARTPGGGWYPAKIRCESRLGKEMIVETTEYYLTFPPEIPNSLFEE